MSNTRTANPFAPLSQERYMSSREFAELQAISGTAVAKRCALVMSPAKRSLLWFIQGVSLQEGGLRSLAKVLLKLFPKRIDLASFKVETYDAWDDEPADEKKMRLDLEATALGRHAPKEPWEANRRGGVSIEEFLVDLCINPRLNFSLPGEASIIAEIDQERAADRFPEIAGEFRVATLSYFKDIIGALVEYKQSYEQQARAEFCQTAISRQIWKLLDEALATRTMVTIEGLEGRGKTEAIQAWCNCHLGKARFVSLKGTNTKTTHFRELARALGVGYSNSYKVSQMQANVEEVIRTSHLMLVIDEAHHFFNQAPRMKTRPEMLDWIDTALCNPPSPVALCTTPQFMICMERAASQVGWNYRQFKRRCKRYWRLPPKNTPEDIEAVTRHLLPGADRATIKRVMAYEALSKRDLSAVGDVAREAKLLADQAGAKRVTFEHVEQAINEVLLVSDLPWAEMEKRIREKQRGRKAAPDNVASAPDPAQEASVCAARGMRPTGFDNDRLADRARFSSPAPVVADASG